MASGIRATVEFNTATICPIVEISDVAGTTIDSVSRGVCPTECDTCVTEFTVDEEYGYAADIAPVFSYGSTRRYRLHHEEGISCPCECLGSFGCSVGRYLAQNGSLTLVFYAEDFEQLQDIIAELRNQFPEVNIKRFIRSPTGEQSQDNVFVDRSRLTARQLEVLQTAYEMGYFDRPREANATAVAAELDIDSSTFGEHVATAQKKLFQDIFEDGP